jgi:hypothetical protein
MSHPLHLARIIRIDTLDLRALAVRPRRQLSPYRVAVYLANTQIFSRNAAPPHVLHSSNRQPSYLMLL